MENECNLVTIVKDGFLDTTLEESQRGLKYNISVLVEKAKKEKKIENFMIIREDDFFPVDWEWRVASKNTGVEKESFVLSRELRTEVALSNANIKTEFNGFSIPVSNKVTNELSKKIDVDLGTINMPMRFRSTKHFTINTPLSATGKYNFVDVNRDFTIIDGIDNFLKSGYAYSVAYHDAYLDVSHEGLPISNDAIILINEEKYNDLKQNPLFIKQLNERKVVIFRGEQHLAINMILSQMGVLPSKVGFQYFEYDKEIEDIMKDSLKNLAEKHNLYFDKSHAALNNNPYGGKGHFSSYIDDKNNDFNESINEFLEFLRKKFPKYKDLIDFKALNESYYSTKLIRKVGIYNLLNAIDEYNIKALDDFKKRFVSYKNDRKNINLELSDIFKETIKIINNYYRKEEYNNFNYEERETLENLIKLFFHSDTVIEQLNASRRLLELLQKKKSLNQMFINNEFVSERKDCKFK